MSTPQASGPDAPPLDLVALDGALSPVRRVLAWIRSGRGAEPRYLGVIGGRWLGLARRMAVPAAAADLLDEMIEALDGFDAAEDREGRLAVLYANLARLDTLLGLPLSGASASHAADAPAGAAASADRPAREPGSRKRDSESRKRARRRSRGSRRRGRASESEPAETTSPAPPSPAGPLSLGDRALGGRPLDALEGAGPFVDALRRAGLVTVGDLLARAPTGEDVVQPVLGAGRLTVEGRAAVGGRVQRRWTRLLPDGTRRTVVRLRGAGLTDAVWEGGAPAWLMERLAPGERAVLVGEARMAGGGDGPADLDGGAPSEGEAGGPARLVDPELAHDDGKHAARLPTFGLEGVADPLVRALLHQILPDLGRVAEPLPAALREGRELPDLGKALGDAFTRGGRATRARARLAWDEAVLANLGLLWPRFQGAAPRGVPHTVLHGLTVRAMRVMDIRLSDEQQEAFDEVKRGLRSPRPMRRVLTGEVGVGKGLVAVLSVLVVAENKHQVMVLAPDRATAEQRFAFTEPLLREVGLVARLYDREPTAAQRDALRRGEVHAVFGALDLLDADLEFRRLGLVVAGERDVFGTVPPKVEALRGPAPDLLVITSTPVPWPVLLRAYPTFDVSVLRQLPGRDVAVDIRPAEAREEAYAEVAQAISRGEQVVVVFPMLRGGDLMDLRQAVAMVRMLEQRAFPGARVHLFHGAMHHEERIRTYQAFRDHEIDVLVATTHFEAGPAVPGVSTIVVEQADHMSLSRLHRVRGHVSVGAGAPRCVLITGQQPDPAGVDRIRRFVDAREGFSVSVLELADRGLDQMVAVSEGGGGRFSWLDPNRDGDQLLEARRAAVRLLGADAGLREPGHAELTRYLAHRWEHLLDGPCPVRAPGRSKGRGGGKRRRRRRKR
jgi:RecG-like helicase